MLTSTQELPTLPLSKKYIIQKLADASTQLANHDVLNLVVTERLFAHFLSSLKEHGLPVEIKIELFPLLFSNHPSVVSAKADVSAFQFDTFAEKINALDDYFISSDSFNRIDVSESLNEIFYQIIGNEISRRIDKYYKESKDIEEFRTRITRFVTANA
ncbi:hypothetical protein [Vibrio sp. Hal054]|uniref:hypothetical protein n=1 Tax=Vibrio sp. Hal054 TaxID=3035158 RepID=UPI00301C063D